MLYAMLREEDRVNDKTWDKNQRRRMAKDRQPKKKARQASEISFPSAVFVIEGAH